MDLSVREQVGDPSISDTLNTCRTHHSIEILWAVWNTDPYRLLHHSSLLYILFEDEKEEKKNHSFHSQHIITNCSFFLSPCTCRQCPVQLKKTH